MPVAKMHAILSIPLFLYLLLVANFTMLSGANDSSLLNVVFLEFMLPSERDIVLTVSDALIMASVIALYIETFKSTRTSVHAIIEHTLSLLVFIVFLVQFLVMQELGNATFLIMTIASLMDVVMGFTVSISTARRDLAVGI